MAAKEDRALLEGLVRKYGKADVERFVTETSKKLNERELATSSLEENSKEIVRCIDLAAQKLNSNPTTVAKLTELVTHATSDSHGWIDLARGTDDSLSAYAVAQLAREISAVWKRLKLPFTNISVNGGICSTRGQKAFMRFYAEVQTKDTAIY